jgi:hypothetical protein
MRNGEVVWEFCTAHFRICLEIEPEEMDPADSFQFEDDIEAVRNGSVEWFCASVVVYFDGREIARDSLGGCAYNSVREFYTSHRDPDPTNRNTIETNKRHQICHYFPSMVTEAVSEARKAFARKREAFNAVSLRQ